jgi:hypothetical protein
MEMGDISSGMLLRGKLLELRQCNTKVVVEKSKNETARSID